MSDDHDASEQIDPEAAYALAKKVIYDRLAERPRSRADLEQALAKRGVPAEMAGAVLDRFESAGLVDDAAFARSWVEGRRRGRGLATRALAHELRQKGVADDIVSAALAEVDPDDERAAAHRLVQTKLRSMARLDDQVKLRRLVAMLARKGYPPAMAYDVVRIELGAAADDILPPSSFNDSL